MAAGPTEGGRLGERVAAARPSPKPVPTARGNPERALGRAPGTAHASSFITAPRPDGAPAGNATEGQSWDLNWDQGPRAPELKSSIASHCSRGQHSIFRMEKPRHI